MDYFFDIRVSVNSNYIRRITQHSILLFYLILSVFHPMNINVHDNKKLILTTQILTSSILSLPAFFFYVSNNSGFYELTKTSSNNITDTTYFQIVNNAYSLSNYCRVQEYFRNTYKYYQIGMLTLFVINLIIITTCYLRVYKHVYKASKNQRRDSLAINHTAVNVQNLPVKSFTAPTQNKNETLNNYSESNSGSNDASVVLNALRKDSIFRKRKQFITQKLNNSKNYKFESEGNPRAMSNSLADTSTTTCNKTKSHLTRLQMKFSPKIKLKKSEKAKDELEKKELSKIEESIIIKVDHQVKILHGIFLNTCFNIFYI